MKSSHCISFEDWAPLDDYLHMKLNSQYLIWRAGTSRWNLRGPDLQMHWQGLTIYMQLDTCTRIVHVSITIVLHASRIWKWGSNFVKFHSMQMFSFSGATCCPFPCWEGAAQSKRGQIAPLPPLNATLQLQLLGDTPFLWPLHALSVKMVNTALRIRKKFSGPKSVKFN